MTTHQPHYHGRHRRTWSKRDTCGVALLFGLAILWFVIISYWMLHGLPR